MGSEIYKIKILDVQGKNVKLRINLVHPDGAFYKQTPILLDLLRQSNHLSEKRQKNHELYTDLTLKPKDVILNFQFIDWKNHISPESPFDDTPYDIDLYDAMTDDEVDNFWGNDELTPSVTLVLELTDSKWAKKLVIGESYFAA